MPVAVMPRLLMTLVAAGRNELVQNGGEVVSQSRLELNGADGGRAAAVENVDCPRLNSRSVHDRSNLLGEVEHVAVPLSGDRNLSLIAHKLGQPKIVPTPRHP